MGCVLQPQTHESKSSPAPEGKTKKPHRDKAERTPMNPLRSQGNSNEVEAVAELPGKAKFISDAGAVVMEVEEKRGTPAGILVLSTPRETSGLQLAFRDSKTGVIYLCEYTDNQIKAEKERFNITHGWAAFFKSIASDVTKNKAKVTAVQNCIIVEVTVASNKDKLTYPFSVKLEPKSKGAAIRALANCIVMPMSVMMQKRRQQTAPEDREREARCRLLECDIHQREASITRSKAVTDRLHPVLRPLKDEAATVSKTSGELFSKIATLDRRVKKLKRQGEKPLLDRIYEEGGAMTYNHLHEAEEHIPKPKALNITLADGVRGKFDETLKRAPANAAVQQLKDKAPAGIVDDVLRVFSRVDGWDFNVFELEAATQGNALFYITYALLYKLNLVQHFNLDDATLRAFLAQLQSGYHPNPYHNAVHAADVTQINYYILTHGGLSKLINMSNEDMLAAILAGAIHDYDHPGFNNNFHTRTSAFLSTLYNDRSILENHHLACIFEMFRRPQYNILAPLSPEQTREVRETMVEMVLSTDMGNHTKIFSSFRRRISEGQEWTRREDKLLALSMSIKTADISNCGRPNSLYLMWAKRIADEFYQQGDTEARLKLVISPFMDRSKDALEFPKGQVSFMNYIVVPLFEAVSEFLPALDFAVKHCAENKEYWTSQEPR